MASTPHDGSGTTFTFKSTNFTVTNIVYNLSDTTAGDDIDISHLGLTTGASMLFQSRPLVGATGGETGKEVTIDYIGSNAIVGGTSGAYTISGGLSLSGNATCISSSITLAMNEVIRGNATFRLA
jgi:hypothetical protein